MKTLKIGLAFSSVVAAVLILVSCSSIPRYSLTAETRWLEGKPYPLSLRFLEKSEVEGVLLVYSIDGGTEKTLQIQPDQQAYAAQIPASDMVSGTLSLKFGVTVKGKTEFTAIRKVRILSQSGYRAELEQGLANRVALIAPTELAYFDNYAIGVEVLRPAQSTTAKLFMKRHEEASYTEVPWSKSALGSYQASLAAGPDASVTWQAYAEISQSDPDLGSITVTVPKNGSAAPKAIQILGSVKITEQVIAQTEGSFRLSVPAEASTLFDIAVSGDWNPPPGSLLSRLANGAPQITVQYGGFNNANTNFEIPLESFGNVYSAAIPSNQLAGPTLNYRAVITVPISKVGSITVFLPARGLPYSTRLLSLAESAGRLKKELANAAIPAVPASVREIDDVSIGLAFKFPANAWFTRLSDPSRMSVDLVYGSNASGRALGKLRMAYSNGLFSATLPTELLRSGVDAVSFVLQAPTQTALNIIELEIPAKPQPRFIPLSIISLNQLREEARDRLAASISIKQLKAANGAEDVAIQALTGNGANIDKAFIFLRRPGDKEYVMRPLAQGKGQFLATVSAAEQKSGFTQYYFAFVSRQPDIGRVEFTIPQNGKLEPFQLEFAAPQPLPVSLEATLQASIIFPEINRADLKAKARLKLSVMGDHVPLSVTFYLRSSNRDSFKAIPAIGAGTQFSAEIPVAMLKESFLEYYAEVVEAIAENQTIKVAFPVNGQTYMMDLKRGDDSRESEKDAKERKANPKEREHNDRESQGKPDPGPGNS